MADNKENRIHKSSIEREQSQTCLNSAEREKIKGSKNLNVPHLRFPEFRGEWEKKSLGEIGDSFIGLTYRPTDVVSEGGLIVFRSSNIQNGCMDYKDIVRVNKNVKEKLITKKDDLLVCARNGSARLIGKNAILHETDANQTFGAFMMVFRSDKNHFVHQLLNTRRYSSQVSENLGARINQITSSDLSSFEFFFPKENSEMNKISALLNLLDERIATQNKVIEKLESLIKGIIYHAKTDGIRNNTWQKTELRKVLQERKEKNANGYDVCSVSVTQGVVNQIEYLGRSFAAKDTQHYNVVKYGDIVYTKSPTGDFPYGIVKRSNIKSNVAVSPLYGVYKPVNDYIGIILHFYFLDPNNALNYLHPLIQKGAKNTINITNGRFLENSIPLPKKEDETKRLAWILTTIQSKIILEQNLLQSYLKQKRYLLRQMFI